MKVLVNAYACSPNQGSEPGMGWNFVRCLSEKNELHIITESKYKKAISEYLEKNPSEFSHCKFYFIKRERHNLLRKIWPPSYYWFYKRWQKEVLKFALELDKKENFDLVHQLNMIGYREPGYLWNMHKPFIWGPIGGFNITPWNLLYTMGLYGLVFYFCRNIINFFQMHTSIRVKNAMEKAAAVMGATKEDADTIARVFNKECSIMPEVGLAGDETFDVSLKERLLNEPLKLCWSGLHIPRKSLNLLLEALQGIGNVELHVLGDGKKRKEWELLSKKLGLKNIVWYGKVDRNSALQIMQKCDVFVQTSLSDATSTVILEAMSLGLPVIALDHLGFANIITDDCGIRIPVKSKSLIVKGFTEAICRLRDNECLLGLLSKGALLRADENSWERKAEQLNAIYEMALKEARL